ncbi:MAG: hypothetical protein IIB71_15515 [Proteobacteria bacterium]|nr:hypothetical protein [Pseudomonadota bacterium]
MDSEEGGFAVTALASIFKSTKKVAMEPIIILYLKLSAFIQSDRIDDTACNCWRTAVRWRPEFCVQTSSLG